MRSIIRACAVLALACSPAHAFVIDDYFGAHRVTDLTLSSDGKELVYVVAKGVMAADDALERTVYLQSLAGNSQPTVVTGLSGAAKLRWIPSKRQLSFVCKQPKVAQLCSYDIATGKTAVLTDSTDAVEKYSFSADGNTLAYLSRRAAEPTTSLYRRLLNDEPGVVIDTDTLSVYDFVDPNRATAQYPLPATLWIKDANGRVSQVPVPGEPGGPGGAFHWSSDGALLSVTYVSADLPKSLLGIYSRTSLGVFERASGDFRIIGKATDPKGDEPSVMFRGGEWIPGAHRLLVLRAFEKESDPWVGKSFPDWTVMGAREPLPPAPSAWHNVETYGSNTAFFPISDRRILQQTTYRGVDSLYQLVGNGVERAPVVAGVDGGSSMFAFSADDKTVAFVSSSLTRLQEIYISKAGGRARQLTHLNDAISKRVSFTAREVTWKSDDGTLAQGWLLEPPASKFPSRPWPMLTHVHGGPGVAMPDSFGPYAALWTYPLEVLVSRGIAVFLPNYRGTKTFGRAFAQPSDNGKEPVEDILSGIQSLIDSGSADRTRLAISGHSHGGWLAPLAMAKGQSRGLKFLAGSFAEGTTNKIMMYALMSGDLNRQVHDPLNGGSFFDAPERYLEDTPELAYRGLSTAVLFEAGATNLGIGMMTAPKATKHFGLPTEYIIYPRTGHNPFLTRIQREIAERNLDWFEFWMLGRVDPAPAKREQYQRWSAARTDKPS
jgi:dipeptidyl aminopeptidase/acylaminoacyl peptidase